MSVLSRSLLELRSLSSKQLDRIFSLSNQVKSGHFRLKKLSEHKSAALLFFEPSTRTRFSFEMAASRVGASVYVLDGGDGSSLEKGETVEDTIYNIAAMKPDLVVVRCGDSVPLEKISKQISIPVISAGWGVQGHPTQALLDAFTLMNHRSAQNLEGLKLLIVGDIKHSRVASSHFELLPKLGAEIAVCSPPEFAPGPDKNIHYFEDLNEGLSWADAVMSLRVQLERHSSGTGFTVEQYRSRYAMNAERMKKMKSSAFLMHPGPINYGVEFEKEVFKDPRTLVLSQVEHGTYVREALFRIYLEGLT